MIVPPVFLFGATAVAFGLALSLGARVDGVGFGGSSTRNSVTRHGGERMHVDRAIDPCAPPGRVVHDEYVLPPPEVRRAPSPWRERHAEMDAEAETDRARDNHAGPWCHENYGRVVVRHDDERGIHRYDFDEGTALHDDLGVGSEIAVVVRGLPHPLDGIHDLIGR